jgi:crotonobetaine/carnitine-CoA ligase
MNSPPTPLHRDLLTEDLVRFQMLGQDIPGLLRHWARHRPDHPALVWAPKSGRERTWTYQQLHDDVTSLAAGLAHRGISVGDKIIVHSENCPEMVLSILACAAAGAVAVTTNTKSTASELFYFATHTGAVAAITQPQFKDVLLANSAGLRWIVVTDDNSGEPPTPEIAAEGTEGFSSLFADASEFTERVPDPMLAFGIMFTSGTTSRPKAVVHTHANAIWASRTGPRNIDLHADDVYLIYLPLFHVNAQTWSFFSVLGAGATAVLMPKWSKTHFWPVATRHGATHLNLMPFVIPLLSAPNRPPNRLRVATWGRNLAGLEEATGLGIYTAFGMTETVTHAIGSKPEEHGPMLSIGRVLPGYEVAVVDQDSGKLCVDGGAGELWIRGTRGIQLFLEYFDNPDANKSAFHDDWFKTGDIVRIDERGVVFYLERDKDLLKVGGENVSAREIEDRINSVPGVASVAVVGHSHPFLDQVVVAFVIPTADAPEDGELIDQIIEGCRADLSSFKVPRAVYVVDSFPLGTLDKILKKQLRELAEEQPLLEA